MELEYETLADLDRDFTNGRMKTLPNAIRIGGVLYTLRDSTSHSMIDMINGKKALIVYRLDRKKENMDAYNAVHTSADDLRGHQDLLVFVWFMSRLRMHPAIVKFLPKNRLNQAMVREAMNDENKLTMHKDKVIGDVADVIFVNFNGGQPVQGKVDTGAELSSLHAEHIQINDSHGMDSDSVSFVFEGKRYKMTVQDKQAVKTADNGVEYRPVVKFNIKVNGLPLSDIMINLNDRSAMPHKLLIGQNILEKGGFLIDPKLRENEEVDDEIDWEMLEEEFKDFEFTDPFDQLDQISLTEAINWEQWNFSDVRSFLRRLHDRYYPDVELEKGKEYIMLINPENELVFKSEDQAMSPKMKLPHRMAEDFRDMFQFKKQLRKIVW